LKEIQVYNNYKVDLLYENKILAVTFNRPPVNALIQESYEELSSIVEYVNNHSEICALVLRAEGKVFCGGGDTKVLAKNTPEEDVIRRPKLRKVWEDLYNCTVPVICELNGAAVGMGAVLVGCCDVIVSSERGYFAIPEINIGLIGGAKGLSRILPDQKIRTMALTGMACTAKDAYRLGAIEAIVEECELGSTVMEYAETIANKGYKVVRKWKETLLLTEPLGMKEGIMIEQNFNMDLK
jgi:enoyl-CoA hydratase